MTEAFAPLAALTILEDQITHIRRDYSRCFDELKRREKESVGDLKGRVERLERRLGEVDQALIVHAKRSFERIDSLESTIGKRHTLTMKALDNLQDALKRPTATKKMLSNLQDKLNGWRKNVLEQITTVDARCLQMDSVQMKLISEISASLNKTNEELERTKETLAVTVESLEETRVYIESS